MKSLFYPILGVLFLSIYFAVRWYVVSNQPVEIIAKEFSCVKRVCEYRVTLQSRSGTFQSGEIGIYGGAATRFPVGKWRSSIGKFFESYEVDAGKEIVLSGEVEFQSEPTYLKFRVVSR